MELAARAVRSVFCCSIELYQVQEGEARRERVRELHVRGRADHAAQRLNLWDRGADDEPDPPEDDHDRRPADPSPGRQKRWAFEISLHDAHVKDLQPDVPVQSTGDDGRDEMQRVADGLPGVSTDALESNSERELALEGVDVKAIEDVNDENDRLRNGEGLQEVHGPPHLGNDLREDGRSCTEDISGSRDCLGIPKKFLPP